MDFNFIKKFEPITIVGHMNADFDSFVSCILMSKYLDFHNISNRIKRIDAHIDENLQYIGIDVNDFEIGILDTDNLFIVDSSFKFNNNIIGCIDHHLTSPNVEINYLYRKSTSCAKIIYDLMVEENYEFSEEEVKMVCLSLFTDSCSFKSSKACLEDKEWALNVISQYEWSFHWFFNKGFSVNKLENFEEFCFNGTKKHINIKNHILFYSSYIQVKENTSEEFDMNCIKVIREKIIKEDLSFWVFVIQNIYNDNSKYIIIDRDSYIIHYKLFTEEDKEILSRGNTIIPKVFKEVFYFPEMFMINYGYQNIIKTLINKNISISTMESCTAGLIASNITDTEGASKILKGAFVTYSNEAKILQGVDSSIIDKFGVYSYETALEMAKNCSLAYNSNIGIGITGTTGNLDENNKDSTKGEIYFCIKKDNSNYLTKLSLNTTNLLRKTIKDQIVNYVFCYLGVILDI